MFPNLGARDGSVIKEGEGFVDKSSLAERDYLRH